MDLLPLGRAGVTVSRVGLGGFELGPESGEDPDVDRAVGVIETSINAGINWLDTSENSTVAQFAIAWVLYQVGVTAAIAGSRDGRHMRSNAEAADLDLAGVLDRLEAVIPMGPNLGLLQVRLTSLTRDGVPREGCRYAEEVSAGVQTGSVGGRTRR